MAENEPPTGSEKRARATQRIAALGEMTGGIAHDFRNLLATIDSALRLAERSIDDPDKVRTFIAGAREAIGRGVRLTSRLLDFARQQELEPHAGDPNEFLRNLELFLDYGAGPGIRVVLDLSADLPRCLIDPAQFSASILNLVINARDAMPGGGEIRIATDRYVVPAGATVAFPAPGVYVRVRVRDSGQGMPPEVLEKIFDPLFTTKGEKGTGLGLPHVRAVMRLIGGDVAVASEPGVGTTVELLFPAAQTDVTADIRRG